MTEYELHLTGPSGSGDGEDEDKSQPCLPTTDESRSTWIIHMIKTSKPQSLTPFQTHTQDTL